MKQTSNSDAVLASIAQQINENDKSRRACEVKGLVHGYRIGQLLLEVKKFVPRGSFLDWVRENTSVTPRMCQIYMKVAKNERLGRMIEHESETISHLTLRGAMETTYSEERRHKWAKKIAEKFAEGRELRRELVNQLAELRQTLESNGRGSNEFTQWLLSNAIVHEDSAEKVNELLNAEYDDEKWVNLMLEDYQARRNNFNKDRP